MYDFTHLLIIFCKNIGHMIGSNFHNFILKKHLITKNVLINNFYEYSAIIFFQTLFLLFIKHESIFNTKYYIKISLYLLLFILIDKTVINIFGEEDIKEKKQYYDICRTNLSYLIVESIFNNIIFYREIIFISIFLIFKLIF